MIRHRPISNQLGRSHQVGGHRGEGEGPVDLGPAPSRRFAPMSASSSSSVSWVTPTLDRGRRGVRSGLALKEALQVGRTVHHIAHMSDWLVHHRPDLAIGHTTPAFAERVGFREAIAVLERDLAKEIVEGTPKATFLQEA